ncbi:4'-phosphopantetheinyl transferase family protein [Flavobacterium aquicola]|uniref:Phosphopantetheinyl transferase (Holo-ACP synthase) n=1 Tax=Flavobacterium aquicola TaxID=1682742 RepID=A0A3E0EJR5_9FLAO|nr:4'-phosphopantetheinyl transferase superfamily protein [Flavobacterium aquicola]REG97970.1 phosphopantetheinyl transferase (holo-ACP synthase) [Flavobacterium aquicola]
MIGNDIIDLELSRKESNWKRKGFLEKVFSWEEQNMIYNDSNPEIMVWNLWSRKEAAYKIYNRRTGIRGYFPWLLQCFYENQNSGKVVIEDFVFYTQTEITENSIYSIAVSDIADFDRIKSLETLENIKKANGIPYFLDTTAETKRPVSITHHGRFQKIISL